MLLAVTSPAIRLIIDVFILGRLIGHVKSHFAPRRTRSISPTAAREYTRRHGYAYCFTLFQGRRAMAPMIPRQDACRYMSDGRQARGQKPLNTSYASIYWPSARHYFKSAIASLEVRCGARNGQYARLLEALTMNVEQNGAYCRSSQPNIAAASTYIQREIVPIQYYLRLLPLKMYLASID